MLSLQLGHTVAATSTVLAAFMGGLALGAWSRAGKDEAELMKNSTATPDGKKLAVNFSMPRQTVVDMINKQLKPGV